MMKTVEATQSFVTYVAGDVMTVTDGQQIMVPAEKADQLRKAGLVRDVGSKAPETKQVLKPGKVVSDVVEPAPVEDADQGTAKGSTTSGEKDKSKGPKPASTPIPDGQETTERVQTPPKSAQSGGTRGTPPPDKKDPSREAQDQGYKAPDKSTGGKQNPPKATRSGGKRGTPKPSQKDPSRDEQDQGTKVPDVEGGVPPKGEGTNHR